MMKLFLLWFFNFAIFNPMANCLEIEPFYKKNIEKYFELADKTHSLEKALITWVKMDSNEQGYIHRSSELEDFFSLFLKLISKELRFRKKELLQNKKKKKLTGMSFFKKNYFLNKNTILKTEPKDIELNEITTKRINPIEILQNKRLPHEIVEKILQYALLDEEQSLLIRLAINKKNPNRRIALTKNPNDDFSIFIMHFLGDSFKLNQKYSSFRLWKYPQKDIYLLIKFIVHRFNTSYIFKRLNCFIHLNNVQNKLTPRGEYLIDKFILPVLFGALLDKNENYEKELKEMNNNLNAIALSILKHDANGAVHFIF